MSGHAFEVPPKTKAGDLLSLLSLSGVLVSVYMLIHSKKSGAVVLSA